MASAVDPPADVKVLENIPQTAPLRRPHSPKRNQQPRDDNEKKSVQSRLSRDNQKPPPRRSQAPDNGQNGHGSGEDVDKSPRTYPAKDQKISPRNFKQEEKPVPPKQAPAPNNIDRPPTVVAEKKGVKEVKIIPEKYMVELLPAGDSFVLSVEASAKDSGAGAGFICTSIHEDFEMSYSALVDEFAADCKAEDSFTPAIGETYAYFDKSDEGWYRARRVSPNSAILLDGGRVVAVTATDRVCRLPDKYVKTPEFCCVIDNAQVGAALKCVIQSKTPNGVKVSAFEAAEDTPLGDAVITRWQPAIQWPVEASPTTTTPQQSQQPTKTVPAVPRPHVINNSKYVLLDVTSLKRACVRACADAEMFETVLQDVAAYAATRAVSLTEPPKPGQLVLALYQEAHYRAMVIKTKAADNRYMIEYVEYGNQEIVKLQELFVCPPEFDLTSRPTPASLIQLSARQPVELTAPATHYVNGLKEIEEMVATIPDGAKTAPSGSLVLLSLVKNNESVNKKLEEMCTPDWKKLEEKGGDVIESECILYRDMRHIGLPLDRPFVMEVTDCSQLGYGTVSGFERGLPLKDIVYGPLTEKINAYAKSDLCTEPYLPKLDELCIARIPPFRQWLRAVMVEQVGGPGSTQAQIYCMDYGHIATVPVCNIRKMMPEFAAEPALANHCEIKDWPGSSDVPLTPAQVKLAEDCMQTDSEGRLLLRVARAEPGDGLAFTIAVPDMLAALR